MHLNFGFSAVQILWTLTFAALLVLLVVLLGRDRARRFPWFTAGMAIMALRMVASRLLYGKMAPIVSSEIFLALALVAAIVALLVVVEMARRAFSNASRVAWITSTLVLLAVGGVVLALWGPWPSAKTLFAGSTLGVLRLLQLVAQKAETLAGSAGDPARHSCGAFRTPLPCRLAQPRAADCDRALHSSYGAVGCARHLAGDCDAHDDSQASGLCARDGLAGKVLQRRQCCLCCRAGVVDRVPMDRRAGLEIRRRYSGAVCARRGQRVSELRRNHRYCILPDSAEGRRSLLLTAIWLYWFRDTPSVVSR